jgi:hypothetical protein
MYTGGAVVKTLYVFLLLPLIIFNGCSKVQETKLITSFTANYQAEYSGLNVSGSITTNGQSLTNINITNPETVSGLNINYKGNEMHITRESLICSADEAYLPQKSFPSLVKSIIDSLSQGRFEKVSENTYSLDTDSGRCELNSDEDGYINQAQIKDCELKITFSEIKTVDSE